LNGVCVSEYRLKEVALALPIFLLSLTLFGPQLLEHLELFFIDVEFFDHVLSEHDAGARELELDLLESADLALIEDLGEQLFAVLAGLIHGFAHFRKPLSQLGVDLHAIAAISAAALPVLTAALATAAINPALAAAAALATADLTAAALATADLTATALAATALAAAVPASTSAAVLRVLAAARAVGVAVWTSNRGPAKTHLRAQLLHLLAELVRETLDLGLLFLGRLQVHLDARVGRETQHRAAPTEPAEAEPAEAARPTTGPSSAWAAATPSTPEPTITAGRLRLLGR